MNNVPYYNDINHLSENYETQNSIKSYIPTRKYVNFNINIDETTDVNISDHFNNNNCICLYYSYKKIRVYSVNYNALRIMSGMAGMEFSN